METDLEATFLVSRLLRRCLFLRFPQVSGLAGNTTLGYDPHSSWLSRYQCPRDTTQGGSSMGTSQGSGWTSEVYEGRQWLCQTRIPMTYIP